MPHWWNGEQRIPLLAVARQHPRGVHLETVRRWCLRGLRVRGRCVRLESWKEGSERFTTQEAYERFVAWQNRDRP
ncbi:MAG: DUF1580 domain-containing protein [Planctomycetaceae bacterium]